MFDLNYLKNEVVMDNIDFLNAFHCNNIFKLAKNNNFYVKDLEILILKKWNSIPLSSEFLKKTNTICYADNKNYKGFLISKNNIIIGFIIYFTVSNIYDNIHFLLIDKEYQKQGYGSLLLKKVIDNSKCQFIKVNKPELSILDFYKKHGFSNILSIIECCPDFDTIANLILVSLKQHHNLKFEDITPQLIAYHLIDEPDDNLFYLIAK